MQKMLEKRCDSDYVSLMYYGSGTRTSPEFQKLLGIAMEMFLLCSDDKESDVRMVADECLNKIIKVSSSMLLIPEVCAWLSFFFKGDVLKCI